MEKIEDFQPREYQVELLEKCLKENIIIFLPTGSGKTFIAVMVIKHKSNELKLAYSEGGKRTFFIVDTVALVSQQAKCIRQQAPLTVGEYSGEMGVDYWDINKWHEELDKNQVLVMTAAIFRDLILHTYVILSRVNLLVIDECHHAVNKHPMRQIMELIEDVDKSERPHILGLTATLLNSNVKPNQIAEEIIELEATLKAKIARAKNEEMIQAFSTNPSENLVYYDSPDDADECYDIIRTSIEELFSILNLVILQDNAAKPSISPLGAIPLNNRSDIMKEITNILKEINIIALELGGYASYYALLSRIVHFERMRYSSNDPVLKKILGQILIEFHLLRKKLDLIMNKEPVKIIKYATPKLRKLFALLKGFHRTNLALIFVERRTTAKVIYYILDDLAQTMEEFENIKPDFIVGSNSNPHHLTREQILERKKISKTLKKFNNGETNILVASDVIEEGIDVKNCNYVFKFDQPKTIRSYIQSKGRARHHDSKYIIFTPNSNSDRFSKNYENFKIAELTLKEKLCYGRDNQRRSGAEMQSGEHINSKEVEPFCVDGPNGPRVTVDSSISLLNRYCSTLPSDKFTNLTVFYWKKKIWFDGKNKVVGYLLMPVNSPLKEIIEGQPCENTEAAKGAVALKACKMLYEIGELNSMLLPTGHEVNIPNEHLFFPLWEHCDDPPRSKPGTKKCRRIYDKQFPKWISECFPEPGKQTYLHLLKITPKYNEPNGERLLAFYNLLKSDRNFAVLTAKKWPKLCDFPLFMNVGEVDITVRQNTCKITFSPEELKYIHDFHCLLFTEALSLKKEFLVKEYENKENTYLVVPVVGDGASLRIDWDTIKSHNHIPTVKPVPLDSRKRIVVNKENYLHKIVIPWYRPKGYMLKYVVTKVCDDETPLSPFPSEQYSSYAEYFQKRYNTTIVNTNQRLIEVRAISGKINCLLPRGKYKLGRKRRRDEEDFEETLVPELCELLDFPAVYMLKVTLLPSILHRITMLLNAEELRQRIAMETGLGVVKLPRGEYWNPLQVDSGALAADENSNVHSTIEVSNMLADKMVELLPKDGTWDKKEEPIDLDRDIRNLNLFSIIHYEKFAKIKIDPLLPSDTNPYVSLPKVEVPKIPVICPQNSPYGPQLSDVLKGLIACSANDIMNYERLETLGDSFLKFIVSLILFIEFEDKDEGKLSYIKGKIIGNRNLFYCGKNINLGNILKVYDFVPDDWEVPGFTLLHIIKDIMKNANIPPSILYQINLTKEERNTAVLSEETRLKIHELFCNSVLADENTHSSLGIIGQHSIADKVIADSVEALIGVYLETCGIEAAFKFCKWLQILPEGIADLNKILHEPAPAPHLFRSQNVNDILILPDVLERILGYKFNDRCYLLQALTHCSYIQSPSECYQRLEFLGDAILDFLITSHIYSRCKNITPGDLTDLRSALVNNVTFACLAVRYGFHKFMLTKACKLTEIMSRFVEHQERRNHKIGAEILFLLHENEVEAAEIVDVPKALGDVFESLAGAIYLDSGKSLETVWKVFYRLMHKEIEEFIGNIPKNSIRLLYEKFPSPAPHFGKREVLNNGKAVMVPLIINNNKEKVFVGVGENKSQAKLAAAKLALRFYHQEQI